MRSDLRRRPLFSLVVVALGTAGVGGSSIASCTSYEPPHDTGGVKLGVGKCGAVTVVSADYDSTNVAIVGFDGSVQSSSIISTGSKDTGLSATLTGDVVLPTFATPAPHFVLLDRFPTAVVTWVNASDGKVEGQLNLNFSSGHSNPQDYVETDTHKAYISRYSDNPMPGQTPFDGGGDLVIVDPTTRTITGRIDMHEAFVGEDPSILPRPGRMVVSGGHLYVVCAATSASFLKNADSRLVDVDLATDTIASVVTLTGSDNCLGLALSPSGERIGVTCPGAYQGQGDPDIATSALIVFDRTAGLKVISRLGASTFGQNPIGPSVTFATDDLLLFPTTGCLEPCRTSTPRPDALVRTNVAGDDHAVLLTSDKEVVTLGDVRCENACGACFAADAEHGVIDRFPIENGSLGKPSVISLHDGIGLPPRHLGSIGSSLL